MACTVGGCWKLKNHPNGISVEMTLKEAKEIAKLTYIPKAGDTGTVGNYIIEAATGTDDARKDCLERGLQWNI